MFELTQWLSDYGPVVGYTVLSGIIFAETGLFFGFFLPGDTILFPAGLLAKQGYFNIYLLCLFVFIAAIIGNCVGYFFGKHVGKKIFHKEDSLVFHKNHIVRAHAFYEKHGGKTIILARFLPIFRTFAPIVAGISGMHFGLFFLYSAIGAAIWAIGILIAGYFLGGFIPDIDKYILPVIIVAITLPLISSLVEILRMPQRRKKLFALLMRRKNN